MADKDEIDEIIEEIEEEEEEEEDDGDKKKTTRIIRRSSESEEKGFLANLSKEDVILGILLVLIGVGIGYCIYKLVSRGDKDRDRYFPHMPIWRQSELIPSAPPVPEPDFASERYQRKWRGRKTRHGLNMDPETGDLLLGEPGHQEHWVVKRNMFGDIIDCYKVYDDDELK